ncbi:LPO_1073/Vpar_1526 family protein [Turicibacter sp. T129]|uniref:LPO_1073/Vpar_1526 family protein n=1 Tax=Turicibacter sp. T129 TaxID=2951141 RepID=UPI0021D496FE|nr:LPO_1073/Vpar_1526 family protein [Turicibacter sp. T129]MCU7193878.1 hypothetical protein [Turicibacter sp. T129]
MSSRQSIKSGEGSVNAQGENVTIIQNQGLTYADVKDIAMTVFKSNFYDLGETVKSLVQERAEKILDDYLEKIMAINPELISKTADPDIRYGVYEVQKNHARRGDDSIAEVLIETLVRRTCTNDCSIQELVLNEALNVIPKITIEQMNILTILFLVRYTSMKWSLEALVELFLPFMDTLNIEKGDISFQHLQYASCISISMGEISFERAVKGKIPCLDTEENVRLVIQSNKIMETLSSVWNNSQYKHASLTSVGITIAISYLKTKIDLDCDLGIWIK